MLGGVAHLLGSIRDVTADRLAEEKLRASEARFRAVVDNSHEGILFTDADGVILYRSPSYRSINGYADEERVGRSFLDTVHPDDHAATRQAWAALLRNEQPVQELLYRIAHKDGSWRMVETSAQNLLDTSSIGSIVLATRDVTERARADERLRESEARFRAVFEQAAVGVAVVDAQSGRFCEVNQKGTAKSWAARSDARPGVPGHHPSRGSRDRCERFRADAHG